MATLNELIECMLRFAADAERELSKDFCADLCLYLRKQMPGEKVYIPAPDTSKKQMVIEAAKKLPHSVAAQRCGVSRQYVNKLTRRET